MRDAVDQQVSVAGFLAGVLRGQATPRQAAIIIVLPSFKRCGPTWESAAHHRVAALVEYMNVDVILAFALFQDGLCSVFALGFVSLRPLFGQGVEARVAAENPRVLVEHVPQQ